MEVRFRNSRGSRIWIAIMRFDPGFCAEGNGWLTEGWWSVALGETVHAFNTDNRFFGYYAESEDGSVWAGDMTAMYIYREAFSKCHDSPNVTAYAQVGVRPKDGGSNTDSFTVNLT
jgi:uncharacterized membrane protein